MDGLGTYRCSCPAGYTGNNCQGLKSRQCNVQTVLLDVAGINVVRVRVCVAGLQCEINDDDCAPDAHPSGGLRCFNGGQCIDGIGGYTCSCPPGFAGQHCEGDVNECLSSPCDPKGSLDCVQKTNDYTCKCRHGFTGRHCEAVVDLCQLNPCQNSGACSVDLNSPLGYVCHCRLGFVGNNCEYNRCGQIRCQNKQVCVETSSGPLCRCPEGPEGARCENMGCANQPCRNGATCLAQPQPPYYQCQCPEHFDGRDCDIYSPPSPRGPKTDCPIPQCAHKADDGVCDTQCNNHECGWDSGDCSLHFPAPWKKCAPELRCWELFNNDMCDEQCNTAECFFDSYECQSRGRTCK
ncbi:UNVERIFIED_CONTAM: hypothetical protein FKN15_036957 [Acipenser sinensis]